MARDDPVSGPYLVYAKSDIGAQRQRQEDAFGIGSEIPASTVAAKGRVCVVADGVGSELGGDIASQLAVDVITQKYYEDSAPTARKRLSRAIRVANGRIYEQAQATSQEGMATTVVCAVLLPDEVVIAHVGDSRAYRLSDDELTLLTRDHSWVQEQLTQSMLTEEEARAHPFRNMLTRALGTKPDVSIEVTLFDPLHAGETLLLCTDGVHGQLTTDEICQTMRQMNLEEACNRLIDLANLAGGRDNATAVVIQSVAQESSPASVTSLPDALSQPDGAAGDAVMAARLRDLERQLVQAQRAADEADDAHRLAAQQVRALKAENEDLRRELERQLLQAQQAADEADDAHRLATQQVQALKAENEDLRRELTDSPPAQSGPAWDELASVRSELVEVENQLRDRVAELEIAQSASAKLQQEHDNVVRRLQLTLAALQNAQEQQEIVAAKAQKADGWATQVSKLKRRLATWQDAARRDQESLQKQLESQKQQIEKLTRQCAAAEDYIYAQARALNAASEQLRTAQAHTQDQGRNPAV